MEKIHKFLLTGDRILAYDENDEYLSQVGFDLGSWAQWCYEQGFDATGAIGRSINNDQKPNIVRTADNGFNFSYIK